METPHTPYGQDPGYGQDPHQPYGPDPAHPTYTAYGPYADSAPPPPPQPRVDARRIWSGGLMTALVAALTAVAGVLLVRGVLGVAVFAPERDGAMGDASTGMLAGGAAVAALVATLLLHLLCLGTPQPGRFFSWIVTLATLVVVLLTFTTSVAMVTKVGTAAVCLAVGLTIGVLLTPVARGAVRGR
ncbi:DUF6069 family protein [Streptomyces sp. CB01635]|uniref:DUF6069 family protein n=1 Tax=unclassified Streptomyces TaxID=2593676 RepID=UPI0018FEF48E|nr:DUF6069 family protein [Streptomyces sp. CB01635]